MGWLSRLSQVVDPTHGEQELDEELKFHIEMETQQHIGRGLSPATARRLALRSFGGVERAKEGVRDVNRFRPLENLIQDFTFTLRQFRKRLGFNSLAVVTLALGIGANSAIFSAINGVLLAPLPFRNGHELVRLRQSTPRGQTGELPFSIPEIQDYRERMSSLVDVVEFHSMSFVLLGREEPQRLAVGVVSAQFFDLMGIEPMLGRGFGPEDDVPGAEAVLVLEHDYWKRSFGGDGNIVGRLFQMNDRPHRVIGVLPAIPQPWLAVDVFMPTSACPFRAASNVTAATSRNAFRSLEALARVQPGVSVEQVNAEIDAVARSFESDYPDVYRGHLSAEAVTLHEELTWQARPTLYLLLATTGLVLLIACANVANLLLTNWLRRQRETAVRVAIGAGRRRLVSQALVESLILSFLGGGLGLLIAAGGLDLLRLYMARFTPRATEISIDPGVLAFTLGLSVLTGVLFSLLPVLSAKLEHVLPSLQAGRHRRPSSSSRLRELLIVGQVAVSCVLLIAAGLTLRSLLKLQEIDPGYRTENVLSASLSINWSRYQGPDQAQAFFEQVLQALQREPGVVSAAVGNLVPLSEPSPAAFSFEIGDRPIRRGEIRPPVDVRFVSEGFFSTIGLPLRRGRLLRRSDAPDSSLVAVVSESFARMYWPQESALGKKVRNFDQSWREIVGIVGDARLHRLNAESPRVIYLPFRQGGYGSSFLVRTISAAPVMERRIKEIVYQVDPQQPLTKVETLDELRRESIASPRLTTFLLGLFALLAMVITLSGISGVIALAVSHRTHEIGIRMALGARQRNVLSLILGQGLKLVLMGLAGGLLAAFLGGGAVAGVLYGIEPNDPLTFLIVAAVFLTVATGACLAPARRATAIDPLLALRSD